jgi:hypothetical protein
MSDPAIETEKSVRQILADFEPTKDTGARSRRAPKKNPDGTMNVSRSRPSSRASDRNLSGSPPIIITEENPNKPQSPKIGARSTRRGTQTPWQQNNQGTQKLP